MRIRPKDPVDSKREIPHGRPWVRIGASPPQFCRILENSRGVICADVVKIGDFLPNPDRRDAGIGDYD